MTQTAEIARKTKETDVKLTLALDGSGAGTRSMGVGFCDHMLDLLARHARLDLTVDVTGDLETGAHHTAEDTGLPLGQALNTALGDPVCREERRIGKVTGLSWDRAKDLLTVEFDPEPAMTGTRRRA